METVRRKLRNLFESTVFLYFMECFFGFTMAIATFYIFPLSVEISGFIIACLGILLGVFTGLLMKKILRNHLGNEMFISLIVLIFYHWITFPFRTYTANGLYLGILTGILLFVQLSNLSKKQQIKLGIWYLFGLVLGILLK